MLFFTKSVTAAANRDFPGIKEKVEREKHKGQAVLDILHPV